MSSLSYQGLTAGTFNITAQERIVHGMPAGDAVLAEALPSEVGVTLVAIGGYGRSELFPFSDVDVLLLVPEGHVRPAEAPLIQVLQQLWDQRIPISHATRTLEETIEAHKVVKIFGGQDYEMSCSVDANKLVTCRGGNDAAVYMY